MKIGIAEIAEYKSTAPVFDLSKCLSAFWLIPDAGTAGGHRIVPIPYDAFAAYLDTLSD